MLLDAIGQATGVPDAFPGYPVGMRAVQLPDPALKSYFLTLFGRSERVTACACERNGEVTHAAAAAPAERRAASCRRSAPATAGWPSC